MRLFLAPIFMDRASGAVIQKRHALGHATSWLHGLSGNKDGYHEFSQMTNQYLVGQDQRNEAVMRQAKTPTLLNYISEALLAFITGTAGIYIISKYEGKDR